MKAGDSIQATTSAGTMTITAGKGLVRTYTWNGATRSAELIQREERWYGSLGAYYPGPGEHWKEHDGITRGVLEEGQQHFKNSEEARKWIAEQSGYHPFVYRNDGLAVAFGKVPGRKQINVEVWQIYIAGKKPTKLAGSNDSKVRRMTRN